MNHSTEVKVATMAEGCLEAIKTFSSVRDAEAYASGFSDGGRCYGAGSCFAVVLTEGWELDEDFLDENDIRQINNALKK